MIKNLYSIQIERTRGRKNMFLGWITFTEARIKQMALTKEELIKKMAIYKIAYDVALPQDWLNDFVKRSGLDYDLVRSTTITAYFETATFMASGCREVMEILDEEQRGTLYK